MEFVSQGLTYWRYLNDGITARTGASCCLEYEWNLYFHDRVLNPSV
jgi:hypothetical protein